MWACCDWARWKGDSITLNIFYRRRLGATEILRGEQREREREVADRGRSGVVIERDGEKKSRSNPQHEILCLFCFLDVVEAPS